VCRPFPNADGFVGAGRRGRESAWSSRPRPRCRRQESGTNSSTDTHTSIRAARVPSLSGSQTASIPAAPRLRNPQWHPTPTNHRVARNSPRTRTCATSPIRTRRASSAIPTRIRPGPTTRCRSCCQPSQDTGVTTSSSYAHSLFDRARTPRCALRCSRGPVLPDLHTGKGEEVLVHVVAHTPLTSESSTRSSRTTPSPQSLAASFDRSWPRMEESGTNALSV
jgi:hypothetical protein